MPNRGASWLAGLALVVGVAVACGEADGGAYTEANRALLSELPLFPGVTVEGVHDNHHRLTEPEGPSGWTTRVVYRVGPEVTDQDVIDFYVDATRSGWESCREDIGMMPAQETGQPRPTPQGTILQAIFFRGGEQFTVNTDGLYLETRAGTYEIGLDHDAHQNFCTGETLRER